MVSFVANVDFFVVDGVVASVWPSVAVRVEALEGR